MCRDTCTMQLQIYIIFEKLWHKMSLINSDLNLVLLWQDLSLVGRWFQSLGAATEKDLSPQVRFAMYTQCRHMHTDIYFISLYQRFIKIPTTSRQFIFPNKILPELNISFSYHNWCSMTLLCRPLQRDPPQNSLVFLSLYPLALGSHLLIK